MARKCIRRKTGKNGKKVCAKFSGVSPARKGGGKGGGKGMGNLGKTCVRRGRSPSGAKVCRKYA